MICIGLIRKFYHCVFCCCVQTGSHSHIRHDWLPSRVWRTKSCDAICWYFTPSIWLISERKLCYKKRIWDINFFLFTHSAFFHVVLLSYVRFVVITTPLQSLKLTCGKILWMSCAVWISTIIVSIGYGAVKWIQWKNLIAIRTNLLISTGFALYLYGVSICR